MRLPDGLCRSLNVSLAMPDLSRSPRRSAIMWSYCSFVARARAVDRGQDCAPAYPQNRRRPHRRALNSYRAALRRALRPGPSTNLALRARRISTPPEILRKLKYASAPNHPRRLLQSWLKTSDSSAVLLYKAKYLLLKLQHGSGRVVSNSQFQRA